MRSLSDVAGASYSFHPDFRKFDRLLLRPGGARVAMASCHQTNIPANGDVLEPLLRVMVSRLSCSANQLVLRALSRFRGRPHFPQTCRPAAEHTPGLVIERASSSTQVSIPKQLTRRSSMRKLRWLVAMLAAVALVPGYAVSQERISVSGQIVEAGSQRPLQGALVSVERLRINVQSDANGRFTINVPAGTHLLRVSFIGYKQLTREITAS